MVSRIATITTTTGFPCSPAPVDVRLPAHSQGRSSVASMAATAGAPMCREVAAEAQAIPTSL
jgi:hypothetical protein